MQQEFRKLHLADIMDSDDFDFFCKVWPVESAEKAQTRDTASRDLDAEHQETSTKITVYQAPKVTNGRMQNSTAILYRPSSSLPDLSNVASRPVTNLADAGLFVPQKPAVSVANRNRMEHRILTEKSLQWLDIDGHVKSLPDPVNLIGSRCITEHFRDRQNSLVRETAAFWSINAISGPGRHRQLELHLSVDSLEFFHHSHFNRELILAEKLKSSYNNYKELLRENPVKLFTKRIEELRRQMKEFKNANSDDQKTQLITVLGELLRCRSDRHDAHQVTQLSISEVLRLWLDLKHLREQQGFTSTNSSISVTAVKQNRETDLDEYQEEIEQELAEYRILYSLKNGETRESFGEEAVLRRIQEKLVKSRRKPGEPVLQLMLQETAEITEMQKLPPTERSRQSAVARIRISVRLVVNDKEISWTKPQDLSQDFTVKIGLNIPMILEYIPNEMRVEIWEHHGLVDRKISDVFIPIPDADDRGKETKLVEFSSPVEVAAEGTIFGSGKPVVISTDRPAEILWTGGFLSYKAGWSSNGLGQNNQLQRNPVDVALAKVRTAGDLRKLVESGLIDLNDPAYSDLKRYIVKSDARKKAEYFRLDPLMQQFEFCSPEEIAANRRFELLRLRDRGVAEFQHIKMVPPNENEVSTSVLRDFKRKKQKEAYNLIGGEDARRRKYFFILQNLREYIADRVHVAQATYSYEDLVREDSVRGLADMFKALTSIFKPQQKLRPTRKTRKAISLYQATYTPMTLVIRLSGAKNLPHRVQETIPIGRQQANPNPQVGLNQVPESEVLRPFAVAVLGDQQWKSTVSYGRNPTWNETVSFSLKPVGNSQLDFLRQELQIHFYDEVPVDILENDMLRANHVFQRLDHRWLGSLSFTLDSLYTSQQIDGSFVLSCPPILLGYSFKSPEGASLLPTGSIFITLDPPLNPPKPFNLSGLESLEDPVVLRLVDIWSKNLRKSYPDRPIKPLVITTEAKTCLASRFVKPLRPPDGVYTGENLLFRKMVALANFVSLIPMISDVLVFADALDIWSTNEQFLQLKCGDEEEHALLMLSYFLDLSVVSFLLIADSIATGGSTFVLTKLTEGDFIWDAVTGKHWRTNDPNCPVKSVGLLVSSDNIYANIQSRSTPQSLNWQLHNKSQWKPLWETTSRPAPITSVQPESFTYYDAPRNVKQEMEVLLHGAICSRIAQDRPLHVTKWNVECNRVLNLLLDKMDEGPEGKSEEHQQAFRVLQQRYNVYGYPVKIGFGNIQTVIEKVTSTQTHKIESNDVEFGLAVNVKNFPHGVTAVWVYFVVLSKKV